MEEPKNFECWLTCDKDGTEMIWQVMPERAEGYWVKRFGNCMHVPPGSIEKWTGSKRTWKDSAFYYEQKVK